MNKFILTAFSYIFQDEDWKDTCSSYSRSSFRRDNNSTINSLHQPEFSRLPKEINDNFSIFFTEHTPNHLYWIKALFYITKHFLSWENNALCLHHDVNKVLEAQKFLEFMSMEPLFALGWNINLDQANDEIIDPYKIKSYVRLLNKNWLKQQFHSTPIIVTPNWHILNEIEQDGLFETHRHISGSALLPLYWIGILRTSTHNLNNLDLSKEDLEFINAIRILKENLEHNIQNNSLLKLDSCIFTCIYNRSNINFIKNCDCKRLSNSNAISTKHNKGTIQNEHNNDLILEREFLTTLIYTCINNPDNIWINRYASTYISWQIKLWQILVQKREHEIGFYRFEKKHSNKNRYLGKNKLLPRLFQSKRTGKIKGGSFRTIPTKLLPTLIDYYRIINSNNNSQKIPTDGISLVSHWIRKPGFLEREKDRLDGYQSLKQVLNSKYNSFLEGLDIANSEYHGWVGEYAPIFSRIRNQLLNQVPNKDLPPTTPSKSNGLAFYPHAGEDFHHLLSGMRAMDETYNFLNMKPGDRIGHGLAMGIMPTEWFNLIGGDIPLNKGEWLDNLVWFYHQLQLLEEFPSVVQQVQKMIRQLSHEIYTPSLGYPPSPEDLYHAWNLRRYTGFLCTNGKIDHHQIYIHGMLVPDPLWEQPDIIKIFELDVQSLKLNNQMIMFDFIEKTVIERNTLMKTHTPSSWLPAIKIIQDQWIERFAGNECAIEVNPTSNLCISSAINSMDKHPIFRWHPVSGSPKVTIVIGSDDPGVFGTELIFEYAVLIAQAKKISPNDQVESWIREIANNARISSKRLYPKSSLNYTPLRSIF